MNKLQALLKLHRYVGKLVCDEMGHDWETVSPGDTMTNTMSWQKCQRCKKTRADPNSMWNSSTSSGNTLSIEVE